MVLHVGFDSWIAQPSMRFTAKSASALRCLHLLAFDYRIDLQIAFNGCGSKGNLSHIGIPALALLVVVRLLPRAQRRLKQVQRLLWWKMPGMPKLRLQLQLWQSGPDPCAGSVDIVEPSPKQRGAQV